MGCGVEILILLWDVELMAEWLMGQQGIRPGGAPPSPTFCQRRFGEFLGDAYGPAPKVAYNLLNSSKSSSPTMRPCVIGVASDSGAQ